MTRKYYNSEVSMCQVCKHDSCNSTWCYRVSGMIRSEASALVAKKIDSIDKKEDDFEPILDYEEEENQEE